MVIEVLHGGDGTLVCCGQPMDLMEEKTEDEGMEKHVPVIEKIPGGVLVKVGSVPHPMIDTHYIEWIEITDVGGKTQKKFLKPGDKPEAEFMVMGDVTAREYCNIHLLWKSK